MMRKSLNILSAVLLFSFIHLNSSFAGEFFRDVTNAKAVWDVTVGDKNKFVFYVDMISKTAQMLKKRGIEPEFVIAIHGPATELVRKSKRGMTVPHKSLMALTEKGVKVEVCSVAMGIRKVDSKDVVSFVMISDNVWEDIIVLQNKGYAYMPVF